MQEDASGKSVRGGDRPKSGGDIKARAAAAMALGRRNAAEAAATAQTATAEEGAAPKQPLSPEAALADAAARAAAAGIPIEALALLEDASFSHLRKLRQHHAWEGKRNKKRDERLTKKEAIVHKVSTELSAADIEAFTERKRSTDKEEKIAKAIEMRAGKQSFNAGKKKKSKINSTHAEHSKRGKLFQMTKYSRRVGSKLKHGHKDRSKRDKFNEERGVKFRINRGWKA